MSYKISIKIIVLPLIIACSLACTKSPEYKADAVIGYWQALRQTNISVNGVQETPYEKEFYIRFLDNNCGHIYDRDENWTNDIKWAFQEREVEDILLISTALNSSGQSSDLSLNTINYLEKFEEMNFRTISFQLDTINGDIYNKGHRTFYVRQ